MYNAKSSDDLKRDGTFRKDRHENRLEEAVKILEEVPPAPDYFDKRHSQKWAETCQRVFDLGVLCENDLDSLEIYVIYWFIRLDAQKDIKKKGQNLVFPDGRIQRNPSMITLAEASKILQQISHKFAGNPQARMTIKTGKNDSKKEDPLDNLN